MPDKFEITQWFKQLQNEICEALELADGQGKFIEDKWEREGGGGGRSRVIQGAILEKGGVNFSEVYGTLSEQAAKALHTKAGDFYATGVSLVIHPLNPFVPIIHMNVRYFELNDETWWFGGGIDLTPIYVEEAETKAFHGALKTACDKHNPAYYPEFKKWADEYFFVRHRNETRGVGGIFFDRMDSRRADKKANFEFVQSVGNSFIPAYTSIIQNKKDRSYNEAEKKWQLLRRGRYAEFNLVWDRGTKFGLETNGRTESILMSLPPVVHWDYNAVPAEGSEEAKTISLLKKGINWIG